jgi:hypothetical protein
MSGTGGNLHNLLFPMAITWPFKWIAALPFTWALEDVWRHSIHALFAGSFLYSLPIYCSFFFFFSFSFSGLGFKLKAYTLSQSSSSFL